jgi:hypothetical protein
MSEFCKCGSIMINGSCTRKSCSNKLEKTPSSRARTVSAKTASTKTPAVKSELKSTNVRRASKCITYNISELPPKEE